jgi:hypothetical protein
MAFHSPRQAHTLTTITEQQVLDNLAMYVNSPGSTPYFALPDAGGTTTRQGANITAGLQFDPTTLTGETLGATGDGGHEENWTVKPILEPERVVLMKCLLAHVTGDYRAVPCEDCVARLSSFFGADFEQKIPSRWYTVSDKKPCSWPKKCCLKYGHYCGTYVSVDHDAFDCLSRVTVAFLDIATADDSAFLLDQVVQIEETFTYEGRTVKAIRNVSVDEYEKMLGTGIRAYSADGTPGATFRGSFPARPRRDTTGSSIKSLLQMNLGR